MRERDGQEYAETETEREKLYKRNGQKRERGTEKSERTFGCGQQKNLPQNNVQPLQEKQEMSREN